MSEYRDTGGRPSGWVVGFVAFAGCIMVLIGVFQSLYGLAAIFEDDFFVVTQNYLYDVDVTAWGWIHLIIGIVVLAAGLGAIAGQTWARVTGIILAIVAAVANFFTIPYYPLWSLLIIALCIAVIWALTIYGKQESGMI
jgi:hypothetical protein